ncbi:hypothetical protein LS684_10015 [Cytobacillus spongiae]|uniref:hypothetical protein n=1 Tax=Cytobacillus spongiae TaxID=2901381 RepID=UPI001F485C38|nr:hypothetical protein [Cytobacillus spongiae]UII57724.1 hypothetical protein LS684_10015 [Cytobacillus spongiae]
MKYPKLVLIAVIVGSWLTVPLIGKSTFKKYAPAATFMSFIVFAESFLARKRVWWWFYQKLGRVVVGELPLILGPFFVGTLWIMKFTYGKFYLYVTTNILVHLLFTYPVLDGMKRLGIASTVRLRRYQLLLLFLLKSLILYGFEFLKDKLTSVGANHE